jgi:hypothetical protein
MLVFPQLATGAATLYPVTRQRRARTVINTLRGGHAVVYADPGAAQTEWDLRATGLTAAEWNAVEALFQAVSGQLEVFTFLDPAGNLLASSEAFGAAAWSNGPLIQLTAGIDDPLGTLRATRAVNAGQVPEAVAQTLNVPGTFQYSFSLWARSAAGSAVTLIASTAGGNVSKTFLTGGLWQRVTLLASLALNTTSVTFGAQLDAGGSVDLFGMQVEAQPAASEYRQTGSGGGVYSRARFGGDQISVTAQGTDVFDALIRIVTNGY